MKIAFRRTILGGGRLNVIIMITVFLLGALTGVAIAPKAHVLYWTAVLDRPPSTLAIVRACNRLAESDLGMQTLLRRIVSPDDTVREFVIAQLAFEMKPWHLVTHIDKIPDAHTREKLHLLHGLDYAEQHRMALGGLCYEFKHTQNPRVKPEINTILESFDDVHTEIRAFRRKMGLSLTEDQAE